jgi:hypothetical protein
MLRTDYPIYINSTEIKARCISWARDYENIEITNQTEDGHDDVDVVRRGKCSIYAGFRCSDFWASILAEFNDEPILEVRFYDVKTKDYITLEMRMDDLSVELVDNSDMLQSSNGLYTVTFNLIEF